MRIEIRQKPWDLVIVIILALLLIALAKTAHTGTIRILLGLVFMLFLPGYVIVSALFPKAATINMVERLAFSLGISIAIVPIMGLFLNYTPWGVGLDVILTSLFILIASVSIIAWIRRSQVSLEDRYYIIIPLELPRSDGLTKFDKALTLMLVIAVIITFSVLVYIIVTPTEVDRYTEFYIFDENGESQNYPKDLLINENASITMGVYNNEHQISEYTVAIELINQTGERGNKTIGHYNLTLEHNQRYEELFSFNVSENGIYKLILSLYKKDANEPYRELHLWLFIYS